MVPETLQTYIERFTLQNYLNLNILRCLRVVEVAVGSHIYTQTQEQEAIFLLVGGKIQVNYLHQNGKTSVLAFMRPLSVVGELELFAPMPIHSNVVAVEPTIALRLDKMFAIQYGQHDPRFLRFIIEHLTHKLTDTSFFLVNQIHPLLDQFVYYLLNHSSEAHPLVTLESKTNTASLFGTSPRHLNRVIKQLEAEGLIATAKNTVHILKRDALARKLDS